MKKIKTILSLAVACALFCGCAPKRSVINTSWTQKPSKVKIVFTEPFVANPDDLADDLPDFVNNFPDWYKAQLEANLANYSNGVLYSVEMISRDAVTSEASNVNGVNVKTPKIKTMDDAADVYLVIDELWIGRTTTTTACAGAGGMGGGGFGMGVGGCSSNDFTGKGTFAYFDAKTGTKLGYGDFESKVGYTFALTQSDWVEVVKQSVESMFENTPIAQ